MKLKQCWRRKRALTAQMCAFLMAITPSYAGNFRDDVVANAGGIGNIIETDPKFTPVVNITLPGSENVCTGTLINARTVLTASHCFDGVAPATTFGVTFTPTTTINTPDILAGSRLVHPGYTNRTTFFSVNDVALLTLEEPVENVTPIEPSDEFVPIGTSIISVGYGSSGSASNPSSNSDGQLRTVNNVIDGFEANGSGDKFYVADFDDPNLIIPNQAGGIALPNEGVPGPGDSGGPLFIVNPDGSLRLIGTVVGGTREIPPLGAYGSIALWTATATNFDWIQTNNPLKATTSLGTGNWADPQHWSGGVVPQNSAAGASATLKSFFDVTIGSGETSVTQNQIVDRVLITNPGAQLTVENGATFATEGTSSLSNGALQLNGQFAALGLNISGGMLSGSGNLATVNGITATGGTIAPGNSIGSLNVVGNMTLSDDAILSMELDGKQSDQLVVTGTADLGGILALSIAPGGALPENGETFLLVNASALTGDWDDTAPNLPGTIIVTGENLTATGYAVTIGRQSFNNVLGGGENSDTASALDALRGVTGTEDFFNSIDPLQAEDLRKALALITPGANTSGGTPTAGGGAGIVGGQIGNRLAAIRTGRSETRVASATNFAAETHALQTIDTAPNPFMDGLTTAFNATLATPSAAQAPRPDANENSLGIALPSGNTDGDWGILIASDTVLGDVDGQNGGEDGYWTQAMTIGLDRKLGPSTAAGAAASYLLSQTSPAGGGRVESEGAALSLYGTHRTDHGIWVDAFSAFSVSDVDIDRRASVGAVALRANGNTMSRAIVLGATLGIDIELEGQTPDGTSLADLVMTPLASLEFSETKTDGYSETGDAALAATVRDLRQTSMRSALGLQLAKEYELSDASVQPFLRAVWTHEFKDEATSITSSFVSAPTNLMTSQDTNVAQDWVRLGAGTILSRHDGWRFEVDAETDIGRSDASRQRLSVAAKLSF
jgi:outer membrane autotransporter protein|tara:strand:+ start:2712 stop:5585 length:2874 start_codon:yes stop_codon:yes gene_type:complete